MTCVPHPAWLVVALGVVSAAATLSAAEDHASIVGYAQWAEQAVAEPPAGVQLFEPLAQRLAELAAERRREQAPDAPQLEPDPGLRLAAQAHALDMLTRDYLDHVGPEGRDVGDRVAILDRRFIGLTGENLAEHVGISLDQLGEQVGPLAVKIADGWLSSPGHRENLLNPEYTHFGMAAAGQGERVVMVHVFGRRSASLDELCRSKSSAAASCRSRSSPPATPRRRDSLRSRRPTRRWTSW